MTQTNAKRKPPQTASNSARSPGGTVVALTLFGVGLATCVVGLMRHHAAGREVVAVVPPPNAAVVPPSEPVPADLQTGSTIPVPDDIEQLDAAVQQELKTRLQLARQSDRSAGRGADFVDAIGQLGAFYEAYGYVSQALDCYRLAIDADPENARWKYHWAVLAYAHGDEDAAIQTMKQVTQRETDYGPAHERLGLMLLERGAYADADEAFQKVVALHPDAASGYVGLGRVRLATNRLDEAAEEFHRALEKDIHNGQAHYLLGRTYQRLGRAGDARNEFARGARSDAALLPDPWRGDLTGALVGPKARLGYARSLARAGRLDEAIDLLVQLHTIFPEDVDVANSLAVAYLQEGHPELALPVLYAAADTGRRSYLTYAHLASTLLRTGELDAALDFAIKATEIAPMTARGYFVKGQVLYAMNRDEEAVVALRKAKELDPRQGEVYFRLGLTAARLGRQNEAIESLETAATFAPHSVVPLYNLSMVHARAGRYDLAADALQRALKIDPLDPRVRTALERVEKEQRNRLGLVPTSP